MDDKLIEIDDETNFYNKASKMIQKQSKPIKMTK